MKTSRLTRMLTLALTLLLMLSLPSAANAFERVDLAHATSLTILADDEGVGLAGVTFSLYQVADMTEDATFDLISVFAAYPGDVNTLENAEAWANAAKAMDALSVSQTPISAITTGEDGVARFKDLKPGLYLLTGDPVEIIPWAYTFSPFLISVPTRDVDDAWVYDVKSDIKMSKEPAVTSVEVVKLWHDKNYEKKRPVELAVTLLRDEKPVATATLNKENGWRHLFTQLPAGYEYEVVEDVVPKNYKAEYDVVNGALVIVNTYAAPVTPEPDLPQTGQLWWPVPVLAGLGLLLFCGGWMIHRKWSQEHEEP